MASQDWLDKDFYKVLGVSKDVSPDELKKVYRKLARKYHPDSNPGDAKAEATFKEITEAHSVLSDPAQRAEYDQIRAMGSGARFTAGGPGGGFDDAFRGGPYGGGGGFPRGAGFEDILGGMFGNGNFGRSSGGFRGWGGPSKGQDVVSTVVVDFFEALHGDTMTLQLPSGNSVKVKIPAGVADGQKIRIRGKGHASPDGGEPGDVVLTVTVGKHPVFERDGLNVRLVVPVTFTEAVLGATIEVPTVEGDTVRL